MMVDSYKHGTDVDVDVDFADGHFIPRAYDG